MTCRSCGATIADKAIVCYRCGAPTAMEPPPVRTTPSRPAVWLLVVLVIGVAWAVWMAVQTSEVPARVFWVAVAVVLAGLAVVRRARR